MLIKSHFLMFILINFITSIGIAKNYISEVNSDVKHFSLQQNLFYLADNFENNRRVFRLYLKSNDKLKDLILKKSFRIENKKESDDYLYLLKSKYNLRTYKILNNDSIISNSSKNIFSLDFATENWNHDWELKYSQWIKETLTPHLMQDIQLKTDCADIAYALRWIFSYINKLPMAIHLGGSNEIFTNETMTHEWEQLPTDPDWKKNQRLFAILKYVLRNTYTHTLMKDSYPVALNIEYLTPGTHHLNLIGNSGHTMIVNSVNENGNLPITLLFSTLPF